MLSKDIETFPERACVIIKCVWLLHNLIRDRDCDSDLDCLMQQVHVTE
jgi:hypothetical protein